MTIHRIHGCCCGGHIRKEAKRDPRRKGRPLPDTLLPEEAAYARAQQAYLAHWYAAVEENAWEAATITRLHVPPKVEAQIYDLSEQYIGAWMERSGESAAREVGIHITDLIDRPKVRSAIQQETYKFLDTAKASVKDSLRETLTEGNKAGENLKELAARVKQTLGFDPEKEVYVPADLEDPDIKLENWRAERIARTESAQSITMGEMAGWQESGVVSEVEWVASGDACEFCLDMDGETSPLGVPFFVVGDVLTVPGENGKMKIMEITYRDVYGPPLHPNDRCALKGVLSDEFQDHPHADDTREQIQPEERPPIEEEQEIFAPGD